jgi:predicted DNA-binding transcriptional regulator AlpA
MTRRIKRTAKGKFVVSDLPIAIAQRRPRLPLFVSSPCDVAGMKAQQRIKIQEIKAALMRSGFLTLDEQTKVLGLSRSTAWSVLKPNHKSSGLSVGTVKRMLMSPRLPTPVRQKVFEYVREKIAGLYGHSERRRLEFASGLSDTQFSGLIAQTLGRDLDRRQQRQSHGNHVFPSKDTSRDQYQRHDRIKPV